MPTTGFKYHVFLSHNSADKPVVEELAVRLRREGIEPWLDKWNLIPGQESQQALEQGLADCASCAVFIGPGGLGPWQNEEMRAAIARRVGEKGCHFRVIPVLLPGMGRPERGRLPAFLTTTTWVEFHSSLDEAEAFRRLVCGIRGQEPGAGTDGAALEGVCPYRGLEVFDVEHAPFFFGREALTEWLIVALRASPSGQENRFLAILGASGSGKSSLARAGLVAALKRGMLDGSDAWPIVILKPGRDPIESLAVELAGLPGGASLIKDTRDLLNIRAFGDDQKSLHYFARQALRAAPSSRRLVVLVDQFEEVFTLCEDAVIRQAFFDNLLYAATIGDGQAIVVLTIRADFYGKCGLYPALAAAMSDHQLLVGPMTEDELRRAIERPARLAGGEFEPGLVEMLLHEVEGQPGSLPLLQFTLMELWQRREGRRLTVAAYRAIGELQGALKNRADKVLGLFDEAKRDLCRHIFLRLTQPGEGAEDTKRRVSFGELVPAGADPEAVEALVRSLADARLITTAGDPKKAAERSVEVAHEALIRGWDRLRQWIDADRAGLRTHLRLTEAAREWDEKGRPRDDYLETGTRLAVAREWARSHRGDLSVLERAFLAASLKAERRTKSDKLAVARLLAEENERRRQAEEERAREAEHRAQEARQYAGRQRWYKRLMAGIGGVAVILALAAVFAAAQTRFAERQARLREAEALVSQAHGTRYSHRSGQRFEALAALQKAAAIGRELGRPPEWFDQLRNEVIACLALPDLRLRRPLDDDSLPGSAQVDFDGALERYARVDRRGAVSIRRVADDVEIARWSSGVEAPEGAPACPRFSRDGQFLAIWNWNHSVPLKVWNLAGQKPVVIVDEPAKSYRAFDFSPDSRQIAIGHSDNHISLYDLASPQRPPLQLGVGAPISNLLAFHPKNRQLAVCCREVIQIHDLATGEVVAKLPDMARSVDMAWHPDGKMLAVANANTKIFIWDVPSRRQKRVLEGHRDAGIILAFNPAGDLLASISWDRTLRLWDPHTGQQLFSTQAIWNTEVPSFGGDDGLLAARINGSKMGLWEVAAGREYRTLVHDSARSKESYHGIAISDDGRLLAVGLDDGIGFWDLLSGENLALASDKLLGPQRCVLFEPSGALLSNGPAGLLRWPVQADPKSDGLVRIGPAKKLPLIPGSLMQIARSKDGQVLASAQFQGGLAWHSDHPEQPVRLGPHEDVRYIAVSPDGRWVATGSHNGPGVKIWDWKVQGDKFVKWLLPEKYWSAVGFSPDGQWLATTGGGLRLWKVGSWQAGPQIGGGDFRAFAFSPDSRLLAVETGAGVVQLVAPDTGREYARLEDPNQARADFLSFSPDGTQLVATSNASPAAIHVWHLRAIRHQLAAIGLDWDLPPYQRPGDAKNDALPLQITVDLGGLVPTRH
jgi:WD40 repeat protein